MHQNSFIISVNVMSIKTNYWNIILTDLIWKSFRLIIILPFQLVENSSRIIHPNFLCTGPSTSNRILF